MKSQCNGIKIAVLSVDLLFSNKQWPDPSELTPLIERAATQAYEKACQLMDREGPHDVSINLSDDTTITELNHSYRGQNKPTNVLSFPFEDDFPELHAGPKPLGDIILAFETVSREADEQNIPLRHHIAHLVVHGILHLFGYDHMETTEAEEMEELEQDILATLDIPSPYRNM